ncbi:MAG: ribosome-binding factor A [Acidimicrobiaceae bacterium]|nr:ribosome-binding factor A [Acidimicrobiaceae bacterium]MEC7375141.1 30S ribosome-binding factor RbfA [Actinomycetota bacterium]MAL66536.1 ribosome-binding factor A [Acidimicrobiaceae bacterium]MEC7404392.1 30S ribosome-binding factor RbfA [Actinomycetota bacterium]MEC7672856.1 30S ribosome-binding factor RbfA [Actinomycetota bacterium]|tara:strand:- start:157 stop:594 length:438 start_codon:yes stop_codon:yes gene_type:complete
MGKGRGRHNRSGAPGTRTAKAGELIRRVIASELEYIEDERLELVSLTGVDVDRDLHKAVIYFTTFDRDGDPEIDEAFEEYRGRLRHAVSQGTQLRRAPELEFRSDSTLRSAARIEEILRQEAERPPVPDLDSGDASEAGDGHEDE